MIVFSVRTCADRRNRGGNTPLHIREVRFRAANNHSRTSVLHHKDWLLWNSFQVSETKLVFPSTSISSYNLAILDELGPVWKPFYESCFLYFMFCLFISLLRFIFFLPFPFLRFLLRFLSFDFFLFSISLFLVPLPFFTSSAFPLLSSFFFYCFIFLCLFAPIFSFSHFISSLVSFLLKCSFKQGKILFELSHYLSILQPRTLLLFWRMINPMF